MGFGALWLAILVSAVLVFLASSVIHMASPWHKGDYPKLANEDEVMTALRSTGLPPGDYFVPRPSSMANMKSPEFTAKLKLGPRVVFTIMDGSGTSMAPQLIQWFIFVLVVSIVAGGVSGAVLGRDASSHTIFHEVGLTTWAAYAAALWPLSIWYRRSWSITLKATVDGLIYALITAGVFIWLWPR
ncbi:MAG TPA: hypothetical protein VN709_09045 [Terriglobales bacterium]|nr:hypothetical protein [Terriglobales bacterium]